MQYLGSLGMDHAISELCYKGTILQKNYWKMTIICLFDIILYVLVNNFQLVQGRSSWVAPVLSKE